MPARIVGTGIPVLNQLVRQSVAPATWTAYDRPVVWIIGHSYVFWAGQFAEGSPGGRNLGFHGLEVMWRGIRGLRWPEVLQHVVFLSREVRCPVVLVIHAGGNDLCSVRMGDLITLMQADVDRFSSFVPELVLVWSEIIPRVVWRGARDLGAVEGARRTINARMARFVRHKGGVVVRHRELEGDNSRLMRPDGAHLRDNGLEIFLAGIRNGIEQALFLLGGGRNAV